MLLSLKGNTPAAILALADGTVFTGQSIGATGSTLGEVVFNTSMTGYQEILTDPSYAGQMIAFTSAHIGNTGVNAEDMESKKIHARGMILSSYCSEPVHYQSTGNLADFLKKNNITGLHGVDTRALTLYLRERGVVPGYLTSEKSFAEKRIPKFYPENHDWIMDVTTKEPYWLKSSHPKFKEIGRAHV